MRKSSRTAPRGKFTALCSSSKASRRAKAALFGVSAILCIRGVADGQIALGSYNFTGNNNSNDSNDSPAGVVSNVIFTPMTRTNVAANNLTDTFGSASWTTGGSSEDPTKYVGFMVSPAAGYQLTLASISFEDSRSATGPTTVDLHNSNDGFGTSQPFQTFPVGTTLSSPLDYDFTDFTVGTGSTGEFRWLGYGGTGGGGTMRLDNIVLFGTITQVAGSAQYWDLNGNTAGIGGAGVGTWDNSSSNWNPLADGTGTPVAFNSNVAAIFGGTAGTVSIAATGVAANGGMEFDVDGYTIGGAGTLTLGSNSTITVVNATDTATINAAISGTNGLSKGGSGTLILNGANNYTGGTNVNAGWLQIAGDSSLGDPSGTLNFGGGTLLLTSSLTLTRPIIVTVASTIDTGSNNATFATALDGGATLTKFGLGTLVANTDAAATRSGATVISGGTLRLDDANALGTGTVSVNAGGVFDLNSVTFGTAASGTLNMNTGATLMTSGVSKFAGATSPSIRGGAVVTFTAPNPTDSLEIASALRNGSATSMINITGAGTVILSSGATTSSTGYIGGTTVDMTGMLRLENNNALGINNTDTNNPAQPTSATFTSGTVALGGNGATSGLPFATTISTSIMLGGGTIAAIASDASSLSGSVSLVASTSSGISLTDASDNISPRIFTVANRITGLGNLTVSGAGTLMSNGVQIAGLSIPSGTMVVSQGRDETNKTSTVTSLSVTGTGALDLNDNDLIYDYDNGGTPDPTKLTAVRSMLSSGYAGGAWTGPGIRSSVAASTAGNHPTGIGYAEVSSLPSLTSFDGVDVNPQDNPAAADMIVMRYTYAGDASLDGNVDVTDFDMLAANYNKHSASWVQGDFNYDGVVNAEDFDLLAINYGQSTIGAPALGTLVPEPATLCLLPLAALLVSRRRGT